ncbi:MAG: RNA polymerase sigma factor RpoD/SigA [Chloroflexota bacterium]
MDRDIRSDDSFDDTIPYWAEETSLDDPSSYHALPGGEKWPAGPGLPAEALPLEDHEAFCERRPDFEAWVEEESGVDSFKTLLSIYIHDVEKIPLLTKTGEIELSKRIVEARRKMVRGIFSMPGAVEILASLVMPVRDGDIPLSEVVRKNGEERETYAESRARFFRLMRRIRLAHRAISSATACIVAGRKKRPRADVTANRTEKLFLLIDQLNLQDALLCSFPARLGVPGAASRGNGDSGSERLSAGRRRGTSGVAIRLFREGLVELEKTKRVLVESNLRLVIAIAKLYAGKGLDFTDLVQEGNIGLMKAVERFDYRRGCRFSTYATWWIQQSMDRAVQNHSRTVRLPVHAIMTIRKISRAASELTQEHFRTPSPEDVSSKLSIPPGKVVEALVFARQAVSLDAPVGEDGLCLGDIIEGNATPSPLELMVEKTLRDRVDTLLGVLRPQELNLVKRRFGIGDEQPHTLAELAAEMDVSSERIRQMLVTSINKLRGSPECVELKIFL